MYATSISAGAMGVGEGRFLTASDRNAIVLGIFYCSGRLTWTILIFFLIGFKHTPALNEVTELTPGRGLLGACPASVYAGVGACLPLYVM